MTSRFIFVIGLVFILWIGRPLFIPLLLAAFLWYLLNAISAYYRKVMPYNKLITKKIPPASRLFDWLASGLSLATFGALIYLFITQIQPMIGQLIGKLPDIQQQLHVLTDYLSSYFGFTFNAEILPNITSIAAGVGSSAAGVAATIGLVLIYMFFMFVEQSTFGKKLESLFPQKTQFKKIRYILDSIDTNMKKYMFMKTFISAVTAILSYFWLYYLGLEFAGVWAFIIFIMNYIPTFGAIVACALPIVFALITANTVNIPILTTIGLIALQILLGNLLEPKLTGKTLNLSTLAILINMVFWGMIWGVAGMFFSVPLLVAVFVICAQFDSARWIAVLLSANGEIPEKED